jgi:hypothetical protein
MATRAFTRLRAERCEPNRARQGNDNRRRTNANPHDMDGASKKRIGEKESLFRETNEGIEPGLWPGEEDQRVAFRCECGGWTAVRRCG